MYFVQYYKQYLLGRHFRQIRTDHAALQWLLKTPEPIGQQSRWVEQLSAYDFEIIHRAGGSHQNADAVSRLPYEPREQVPDREDVCQVAPVTEDVTDVWSSANLRLKQEEDPGIRETKRLLENFPDRRPLWSELEGVPEDTKIMWTVWSELRIIDGVLYRASSSPNAQGQEKRLVVPAELREALFRLVHEGMSGGHLGTAKTRDQVRQRAYWPGWSKDVEVYIQACEPCARFGRGKAPKQGSLHPMTASSVWETLGVDITGPHPRSSNGFVYILTAVDHFSKFAFAFPMRNQEASTVARLLVDNVFCLVGAPYRILTDQGANFESELFRELCQAMGIEKIRTSRYKPSTNGVTERFHRTLNSMLAKCVKESQRDWDQRIPMVMAAYRASKHSATSLSPNRVVFGRENTLPADLVLCDPDTLESSNNSVPAFVLQQQVRFREAYQLARNHLKVAAGRRKAYYDIGVHSTKFKVGDRVWYFYPRRYVKRSRKWQFAYVGPYVVAQKLTDLTYLIKKTPRERGIVVHVDKLKKCADSTCNVMSDCRVFLLQVMEKDDRDVLPNQCLSCMKTFTRPAGLRQHVESVHQNLVWFCPLCSMWQCSRSNITRHFRRQHKEVVHPPEPVKGPRPPKVPSEGNLGNVIENDSPVSECRRVKEGQSKERSNSDRGESSGGETTEDETSWNRESDSAFSATKMRFSPLAGTLSETDRLMKTGVIPEWARRMKFAADNDREGWAKDFAKEASVSVSLARVLVEAFAEMREALKEPEGEQMSPASISARAPEDGAESTSICQTVSHEKDICVDFIQTPLAATMQSARDLIEENRIDEFRRCVRGHFFGGTY